VINPPPPYPHEKVIIYYKIILSLLNLGSYIRIMIFPWNNKLSNLLFNLILLGLTVSMIVQVTVSVQKVMSSPTGASIEFKETNSAVNLSLTVCKIDYDLNEIDGMIKSLFALLYRNKTAEIIEEHNLKELNSRLNSFYWFKNDLIHICNTISLKFADEIELVHLNNWHDENMLVYIHETGLFGSGYEKKIDKHWLKENMVALLELEQIVNLPNPLVCNENYLFDQCKLEMLSVAFFDRTGCSMTFPRYTEI